MGSTVLDMEKADRNGENKPVHGTYSAKNRKKVAYQAVKRAFDIVASVMGLLVLGVPMLLIALLIRLDSCGPAIFKQERIGKDGKVFVMYKFRTMRLDAPNNVATNDLTNARASISMHGASIDMVIAIVRGLSSC